MDKSVTNCLDREEKFLLYFPNQKGFFINSINPIHPNVFKDSEIS